MRTQNTQSKKVQPSLRHREVRDHYGEDVAEVLEAETNPDWEDLQEFCEVSRRYE